MADLSVKMEQENSKECTVNSKSITRLKKKKRKMEATLEIAKLNDVDSRPNRMRLKIMKTADKEMSEDNSVSKPAVGPKNLPLLYGDDYLQLKKELQERKRLRKLIPRFLLKDAGELASLLQTVRSRIPLSIADIQHLILYSVGNQEMTYHPHRWCKLECPRNISHTVTLIIEGINIKEYEHNKEAFSSIGDIFDVQLEMLSPTNYSSGIGENLATIPLSMNEKQRILKEFGGLNSAVKQKEIFQVFRGVFTPAITITDSKVSDDDTDDILPGEAVSRCRLLLSPSQLVMEGYPLQKDKTGYEFTKDTYEWVTNKSPMFALDCEMCLTDAGLNELTRVSVVNEKLEVVYDALVKPYNKIINYLTKYSGITAEMLRGINTRIEDVQKALQALLPANSILVGQSLNFDLHALKLIHPYVMDTSCLFNITNCPGRKTKLSKLSKLFLEESIQTGTQGHSPVEDSSASMKLVLLKLRNGFEYGDSSMGGFVPEIRDDIWKVPDSSDKESLLKSSGYASTLFKAVNGVKKTVGIIGTTSTITPYIELKKLNIKTDRRDVEIQHVQDAGYKQFFSDVESTIHKHNLVIAHCDLTQDFECATKSRKKIYGRVNKWIKRIFEFISINGMFVVMLTEAKNPDPLAVIENSLCCIRIRNQQ